MSWCLVLEQHCLGDCSSSLWFEDLSTSVDSSLFFVCTASSDGLELVWPWLESVLYWYVFAFVIWSLYFFLGIFFINQLHGGPLTRYMYSPDWSSFSFSFACSINCFSSTFCFLVRSWVIITLLNGSPASLILLRFWNSFFFLFFFLQSN